MDLNGSLERFGLEKFRPGQREAVETLLRVGRLLLVAPTGGGKSLVYQLPAASLPGTSLIVSPLVSLMQDQVSALETIGVPATFLAATLEGAELRRRMRELGRGSYKLAYVAPERLAFDGFRSLLADLECPLIAVDEAHCISEWGHDFRPEYMQIGEVIATIPDARVLACTATATPVVRDEILERLGLPADTPQLVRGFARPNLALGAREVASKRDKNASVDATLREALGAPGQVEGCAIVYAPTRKSTEQEATRLTRAGYQAEAYHAGLRGSVREAVHARFSAGQTEVVVATNAFGMGIDRSDVRAVVHLAPPSSIEAYYQEVGRAGRDGDPACGQLLVSAGDLPLRRYLIESDAGGGAPDPEIVRHKWNLFLELMRWAEGGSCRHDAILRYFGDEEETLAGCGRCDVCLDLVARGEDDEETVTLVVRKALSGIARLHGRFGLQMAAKLLHGSRDERLAETRLDQTPTFGVLSEHAELWITKLLRRCVTAGWVDFIGGDRPVVVLTEEGARVMRAELPARLVLPAAGRPPARPPTRRKAVAGRATAVADALDEAGEALFEALRHHRLEVARAAGVPPYVVASDRTLRDIALLRPRNREELLLAHGIGPAKADRFGKGLLDVVKKRGR
ncbi:MAG: ATP-dependent DNA helicase RecQ [bacterium]|nr:ATP-dependent DNA helicase RecQ [bacterium]MCP5069438.1 ATP-dependent DNA helicase RecQ [bacterium]